MATGDALKREVANLRGRVPTAKEAERLIRLAEQANKKNAVAPLAAPQAGPTRPPAVQRIIPSAPSVSIIVTARNYGRYLSDCLNSCLAQTAPTIEVIYSDDGSTDGSLVVARRFQDADKSSRLKVIAHSHTGVAAARNRGGAVSRGEVLIHVDGDDMLPNNFVAAHLDALAANPRAPFVYGPAQAFGTLNSLWPAAPVGPGKHFLWDQNTCNTSSAIRRQAFAAAGAWRENPSNSLWDWDLFLRLSRLGQPAVSDALLLYRQHRQSWSRLHGERRHGIEMIEIARRFIARLSIVTIYSGRLPALLPRWFAALSRNVVDAQLSQRPELLILNNSPSQRTTARLWNEAARHEGVFSSVRILPQPDSRTWKTEQDRRNGVSSFLAAATTRAIDETSGELIWLVEDDVVPPRYALARLWLAATSGEKVRGAVAGVYQNRHTERGFVGGWLRDGEVAEVGRLPRGEDAKSPLPIDLTGTGCLLFWRGLAPPIIEPCLPLRSGLCPAHDWWLCDAFRRGGREVAVIPAVRCRHYQTAAQWV